MNTNTDMNTIDDLMAAVTVGSPARHRNLSVYPLRSKGRGATAAYLVLDDALATGRFRITEVSQSGSVPRLLAINDNGSPVFLLDGEELVGAKQNRVLNLSSSEKHDQNPGLVCRGWTMADRKSRNPSGATGSVCRRTRGENGSGLSVIVSQW